MLKALNLRNATFQVCDVNLLNPANHGMFDLVIAFETFQHLSHPQIVLQNVFNCLMENGSFLMIDTDASSQLEDNIPHGSVGYSLSTLHSIPITLSQDGGAALGSMLGSQKITQMLAHVGFLDVKYYGGKRQEHGVFVCKK